jgi:hypothetical protein
MYQNTSQEPLNKPPEYQVIDDRVVRISSIVVHEFSMGDVEDPDLYAAQPISEWQASAAGEFVMAHAVEKPYWTRRVDQASYGYQYAIVARMREQDQTFFRLKFG